MYAQSGHCVNEARTNMFNKAYRCNNTTENILKITKSLDSRLMPPPPCHKVLVEKIKRTKYICSIWCNSTLPKPTSLSPLDFGWSLIDNKYSPKWSDGDQTPNRIEYIANSITTDDDSSDESDVSYSLTDISSDSESE